MPELPDVEVYRQYLIATALHQQIEHVHVESRSILLGVTPQSLGRTLKHKSFHSIDRHGKYLFTAVENRKWLVMHFGMTGNIKYFQSKQDMPDYTRFLVTFENGYHLAYIALRKLGIIAITDSPETWTKEHNLGPDALELTEGQFIKQAKNHRSGIKSWLMNQGNIAGIGNIYSDEILFQAGIHPMCPVSKFDEAKLKQLYKTSCSVLLTAINAHTVPGQMPATFLLPHRKQGGRCPLCNTNLEKIKAAGRTAWYCPRCQKP